MEAPDLGEEPEDLCKVHRDPPPVPVAVLRFERGRRSAAGDLSNQMDTATKHFGTAAQDNSSLCKMQILWLRSTPLAGLRRTAEALATL